MKICYLIFLLIVFQGIVGWYMVKVVWLTILQLAIIGYPFIYPPLLLLFQHYFG